MRKLELEGKYLKTLEELRFSKIQTEDWKMKYTTVENKRHDTALQLLAEKGVNNGLRKTFNTIITEFAKVLTKGIEGTSLEELNTLSTKLTNEMRWINDKHKLCITSIQKVISKLGNKQQEKLNKANKKKMEILGKLIATTLLFPEYVNAVIGYITCQYTKQFCDNLQVTPATVKRYYVDGFNIEDAAKYVVMDLTIDGSPFNKNFVS